MKGTGRKYVKVMLVSGWDLIVASPDAYELGPLASRVGVLLL